MPFLRIMVGLVLLISGVEKAIAPFQNFLYAMQAYQVVPTFLEPIVAQIFPWIELFVGLFLVLGLWTPWALRSALLIFAMFIIMVAQALWRGLPLDNCGCFGELIHVPPRFIIMMDSLILLTIILCLRILPKTQRFSLDSKMK